MKTFTQLGTLYQSLTNNSDSANVTFGNILINDSMRTICNIQGGKLRFLESVKDMYTVADLETYQIPNSFRKLIDIYVYSGDGQGTSDVIYSPEMIFDPTKWKRVLQYKLGSQDIPYFTYVENTTYKIQPIPSTSGRLIKLRGRLQVRDMSIADVTNITVTSIANADTAMVVSGSLTQDFVGRYIQITETSAVNGGDGFWYEIASVQSATTCTLTKPYEGVSIVAGTAACTIGQVSVVPQAYQPAIVYRSVALYYQQKKELERAKTYWMMYDGGMEAGYSKEYGGLILQMIQNEGETEEGSYIPPFGTLANISTVPYYFPFQLGTGFN